MSATAAVVTASDGPVLVQDLDSLACRFLELERAAAEAYLLDMGHEEMRDRLLTLLEETGAKGADDSRILNGRHYEIKLVRGASNYFDPGAVCGFRYALINHKIARGQLTDIFSGTVRYAFTERAHQLIRGLDLPPSLRTLYENCRSRTPILNVSPISTTCP